MRRIIPLIAATALLAGPALAQEATGTFIDVTGAEAGTVTLTQGDGAVLITGSVMGLAEGDHGIHFHTTGDCDSAGKFESAGGHFNPTSNQHGLENTQGPHVGDLPNVAVAGDGTATLDMSSEMVSLVQGEQGYVFDEDGTALIVHAGADDQMTDPSGNSGGRAICAVIEAAPSP